MKLQVMILLTASGAGSNVLAAHHGLQQLLAPTPSCLALHLSLLHILHAHASVAMQQALNPAACLLT